jgi:hypothetical protein
MRQAAAAWYSEPAITCGTASGGQKPKRQVSTSNDADDNQRRGYSAPSAARPRGGSPASSCQRHPAGERG